MGEEIILNGALTHPLGVRHRWKWPNWTLLSDPESSPINSLLPDLLRVSVLGAECFQFECQKMAICLCVLACLSMFASRRSVWLEKTGSKNNFSSRVSVMKWRLLPCERKLTRLILVDVVNVFLPLRHQFRTPAVFKIPLTCTQQLHICQTQRGN